MDRDCKALHDKRKKMKNYFIRYNLKLKLNNGDVINRDSYQSLNGYKADVVVKRIEDKLKKLYKEKFLSFEVLSVEVIGYY